MFVLASIGGVFATWHYAYGTVANVKEDLSVSLSEFEWKPDEILPTESEIGENHLALIELILNENKKGYGLNYDNKHVLEEYLENHRIIFSNQKVTGGNLKFVSDETNQLYYCVEKISDTMYYAYTFSYPDLNSVKGTTTVMPVYRRFLKRRTFGVRQEATLGMHKPNRCVILGQKMFPEHSRIPLMLPHGLPADN